MKISQKSPKKSAPAAGFLGRSPRPPDWGDPPRESTPVAPGGPSTPQEEDAAVQGVAGKVDESLERRDERACATGGGFSMPQAAPTSMGYHSCDCIEEGFNIQQTGIEGDRMSASDVSSVPIVTNQSHPSSQISACTDPESSAAPSRARRASAASTSAFNLNVPPPCARAF